MRDESRIADRADSQLGNAQPSFDFAQQQNAAIRGQKSNLATTTMPETGDKPKSGSVGSFMAGVAECEMAR
ncbi:hypothetical protein JMJ47_003987 (plasmid) [Methylocystis sp. MJC1]|nr:hypothetical protein [Methylocystis sp. MJC1]MBU6529228.1 hypothetical protein [Methylocystis sp. MJC1]